MAEKNEEQKNTAAQTAKKNDNTHGDSGKGGGRRQSKGGGRSRKSDNGDKKSFSRGSGGGNRRGRKRRGDDGQQRDKTAPSLDLGELQAMSMVKLTKMALDLEVARVGSLTKHELIFEILKANTEKSGLMYGGGALEVLPDGVGFLRSPEYRYTPCPEDNYMSPSQIRRFSLRTWRPSSPAARPATR